MPPHRLLAAAAAAAVTLAAAGCAGHGGTAGGSGHGSTAQTVTIALGGPFSGAEAPTGQQIQEGAALAANAINAAGGISAGPRKGDRIVFKNFDDADDPALAASDMRRIVDDPSIIAFVGSGLSDGSIAAAPIASRANLTYLAAYASSAEILAVSTAHPSVFIVPPTFPAYAFSVTDELLAAGYRRPALLHLQGSYGDGVANLAVADLHRAGVRPVADESFTFSDTDLRPQLARIASRHPDSLLLVGLADSDALALRQAAQLGLSVPVFDPGGITNDPTFLADAGSFANGLVGNTPDSPAATPAAAALQQAYKSLTGSTSVPDPGAFSYVAVQVVAAALAAGASDRSDLAAYVHQVDLPSTAVGPVRFASDGARLGGVLYIYRITRGQPQFYTGYQQTGPQTVVKVGLPG
ncbi:MAG: ABC transporter substrate-binding protein [Mycobacteriales bacterium]